MGMATLTCILVSDKIVVETLSKMLNYVVSEARKRRENNVNIIFFSNNIKNVFRYKDIFTAYIDIGIRIYAENKVDQLKNILTSCNVVYVSQEDQEIIEFIRKTNIVVKTI
uniref:Uncharacterized protein n=1 Tax=Ignisphaera aggregans TaxID=334771 RepID=A0A7C5UTB5_9CREN